MVYILFPYWNVLPKAHFTKEPTRQILGKQFLHRSYPWTISRLTPTFEQFADSLLPLNNFQTHCMFIVVQLHPQHKQKSVYRVQNFACQRLLWAFCFLHLKPCIEIFRKMCFEVWLKDWVTEVGGGTWLGGDLQNGNFQICPLSPHPSPFPSCCWWVKNRMVPNIIWQSQEQELPSLST